MKSKKNECWKEVKKKKKEIKKERIKWKRINTECIKEKKNEHWMKTEMKGNDEKINENWRKGKTKWMDIEIKGKNVLRKKYTKRIDVARNLSIKNKITELSFTSKSKGKWYIYFVIIFSYNCIFILEIISYTVLSFHFCLVQLNFNRYFLPWWYFYQTPTQINAWRLFSFNEIFRVK